jgi:hypothetical protein
MNEKVNINKDYICKICNKKYSSLSSLCNHNKKFHNINSKHEVNISKHKINIGKHEVNISKHQINTCKYCNKIFSCKQSRWRHEKTCKHLDTNKIDQLEEKNKELEETINEMKEQFALIIKEKGKIHHKTLQKINNQLNNNNNNVNNNINNGKIINNINNTYVKFGDLDYQKVLNNKQIKHILNHQYMSLEESIKQIHFNEELPEYNNIFITNMKDDLAYVFDGKQFISVRKNEMLNELIDTHVKEINLSLEKNKNKLNEKYVIRLEKFLDMLNDDDTKFTDQDNQRIYPSYKAYKLNSIKLLIYNGSDKKKLDTLNTIELEEKVYNIENNIKK